jgi:anti-anti-sigma factor
MLSVVIENSGESALLHCSGRIVAGEEAWTLFNHAISLQDKRTVVLDLTRVTGADARGLGVLVLLKQWARPSHVKLQVIPSKPVLELLEQTGLDSLFDIRDAESVGLASDLPPDSRQDNPMAIGAND